MISFICYLFRSSYFLGISNSPNCMKNRATYQYAFTLEKSLYELLTIHAELRFDSQ